MFIDKNGIMKEETDSVGQCLAGIPVLEPEPGTDSPKQRNRNRNRKRNRTVTGARKWNRNRFFIAGNCKIDSLYVQQMCIDI